MYSKTCTSDNSGQCSLVFMFFLWFLTPSFFWFRYTLDEFGTARRTAVVRGLIDALTRGGNSNRQYFLVKLRTPFYSFNLY